MIELLLIINYIVFCVTTANFVIGLTHLDTTSSVFLVINLLLAVITAVCIPSLHRKRKSRLMQVFKEESQDKLNELKKNTEKVTSYVEKEIALAQDAYASFDDKNIKLLSGAFKIYDALEVMRSTTDFDLFRDSYDMLIEQFEYFKNHKDQFNHFTGAAAKLYAECHRDARKLQEDTELILLFDEEKLNDFCILLANECSERFVASHRAEISRIEFGEALKYHNEMIKKEGQDINNFVDKLHAQNR
ncbi:hypothetical protein [Falsiporphyromonas endometrii]|uniref:Uncharacterized protein n=1 Tax=Falsiporphyromonas endometrii TaxID=1387297 RepID=A0ABV9K6X7_9PORP